MSPKKTYVWDPRKGVIEKKEPFQWIVQRPWKPKPSYMTNKEFNETIKRTYTMVEIDKHAVPTIAETANAFQVTYNHYWNLAIGNYIRHGRAVIEGLDEAWDPPVIPEEPDEWVDYPGETRRG